MESMAEMKMSRLPAPTWHWLGMNECVLEEEDAARLNRIEQQPPQEVSCAPHKVREKKLCFACKEEENKAQKVELHAQEESCLTVWMGISSDRQAQGLFALETSIKVGKNARVRLVQVQLLGTGYRFVNDIRAECREGGRVEVIQLLLGSARTWSAFLGDLAEANSSVSAQIGYWGRDTKQLDMNYVVLHKARQTKSRVLANGVLADKARKLFRGTIDFKQGAAGSEGEETEEVLMLGDEAVSKTIPLILCGEEDVQGNHGATIGEPDEEVLFYLAARGIGREEAIFLLASAKIEGLRAQIGDGPLEEQVQEYLEELTKMEKSI